MPFSAGTAIGTNTSTSGASVAVTVPAAGVPPGSLIIVMVTEKSTTGVNGSLADTQSNTWNTSQSGNLANTAADGRGMVFFAFASKAMVSGNTITYTKNTSGSICAISAWYHGGIRSDANPEVTAARNVATGTTGTITVTSSAGSQGSLFIGVLCDSGTSTSGGNATFTQDASMLPSAGFEARTTGSGNARVDGGWEVASGSGTMTYAPSLSSTAQQWILFITAFTIVPDVKQSFGGNRYGQPPDPSAIWVGKPIGFNAAQMVMAATRPPNRDWAPATAIYVPPDWIGQPIPMSAEMKSIVKKPTLEWMDEGFRDFPEWQGAPLAMAGPVFEKNVKLPTPIVPPFWGADYNYHIEQPVWTWQPPAFNIHTATIVKKPTLEWLDEGYKDPPDWLGTPILSNTINLQSATPAITSLILDYWVDQNAYTYDSDVRLWQGKPIPPNYNLKSLEPFSKLWRWDFEPDKYWQGQPEPAIPLPMLGIEPFSKQWEYHYEPDKFWLGTPIAVADPLFMLTSGGPPFHKQWRYDYEPDKLWQGSPIANYVIEELIPASKLWRYDLVPETFWQGTPVAAPPQQVTQPFSKQWHYDLVPPPDWLGTPQPSDVIFALTAGGPPFHKQWEHNLEPDKVWQGQPIPTNIEFFPFVIPFSKQWEYNLVPDPVWTWAPPGISTLGMLDFTPFHKQWRYDLEPDKFWQGEPTPALPMPLLLVEPFFNEWSSQYTYDSDTKLWQRYSVPSITLNMLVEGGVPFSKDWVSQYTWNTEYPQWQGSPTSAKTVYLTPIEPPHVQWYSQTTYDPDVRLWEWTGTAAETLYALTAGGAPFHKLWRYDYLIEYPQWQGAPSPADTLVMLAFKPFSPEWERPRSHHEPDKFWQGQPIPTNVRTIPTLEPFSNEWFSQYTLVPEPFWQGKPLISWTIRTPIFVPFSNEWNVPYTQVPPSEWVGEPLSARTLTALTLPKMYGQGGQAPTKLWRYDYASGEGYWQGTPTSNPMLEEIEPFSNEWFAQYTLEPDKFWQGSPLTAYAINQPQPLPFSKLWSFDYERVPQPSWLGQPQAAAALQSLTQKPVSPTKQWHWDADFNTFWQGRPVPIPGFFVPTLKVVIDPDSLIPHIVMFPGRKASIPWFKLEDRRQDPLPDEPLWPRRKDPLETS